jgi:hypothetical protein
MTEIDWTHRESLRMWAVLAGQGHEGAQAVAAAHGLTPLAAPQPLRAAPVPRPVSASVPQAPRATVPTTPQPTVALTGIERRVDMFTKLISPPVPPDLV